MAERVKCNVTAAAAANMRHVTVNSGVSQSLYTQPARLLITGALYPAGSTLHAVLV